MNSMTNVPTRLATLVVSNAMDKRSTTLAVVKLNGTSVRRNFQNVPTSETSPTRLYTMPPKTRFGTRRNGRMSKRTLDEKYVNEK